MKLGCVPILQTMPERTGKLLLIILCLLPCSVASFNCSLSTEEAFIKSFSCRFYQNASSQFLYGSEECAPRHITRRYSASSLDPGLGFLVYIISDLAPLIVYFPVLIIFNINLASGPCSTELSVLLLCSYCQLSAINTYIYRNRSLLGLANNAVSN